MPELTFSVTGAAPVRFAATPQIALQVRIASDAEIQSILLRCQVRMEPARRAYTPAEESTLVELFGPRADWARSRQSLMWTQATLVVPPFHDTVDVELPLPCGWDLTVTAIKLLDALDGGELPLTLLFSGTIFHGQSLQVQPIPWSAEARYALPVSLWRAHVDELYPHAVFLPLRKDLVARLQQERRERHLLTIDETLEQLLR